MDLPLEWIAMDTIGPLEWMDSLYDDKKYNAVLHFKIGLSASHCQVLCNQ